jgi:primosomal protein N' (replication factor Y)
MNERIFQLVTQVLGRAGREKEKGKIIMQIDRETKVFSFIQNHNQEGFYRFEIENRHKFNLPPFVKFIAVVVSAEDKEKALNLTKTFQNLLQKSVNKLNLIDFDQRVKILGPSESFVHFLKKSYRYRFLIKIKDKKLTPAIKQILKNINSFEKNIKIDVDPFNFT